MTAATPLIRPYAPGDLDALLDVWRRASLIAHPFLSREFLDRERVSIREKYVHVAETWVAELDGAVIGFVSMLGNEVGAIFVDPDRQAQGVGRALMDFVRGPRPHLELEVFKANAIGRAFYDAYGFTVVSERTHEDTGQPLLRLRLDR